MATEEQRDIMYREWYEKATDICENLCGLGLDDLEDGLSRDEFDAGTSPGDYVLDHMVACGWEVVL